MTEFKTGDRVRYQHKSLTTDGHNGRIATVNGKGHWWHFLSITFEDGATGLALPEELTPAPDRSLYEQIEELAPRTIFRVGGGMPFLRTQTGIDYLQDVSIRGPIPVNWKDMICDDVTVLYSPEEL